MYFCYFVIFTPGKEQGSSFEQTWIPFTQGCFVPSLVEIDSVNSGEDVNVKSLRQQQQ